MLAYEACRTLKADFSVTHLPYGLGEKRRRQIVGKNWTLLRMTLSVIIMININDSALKLVVVRVS
jgi:hypothetical protein